jgi:sugar lactone lactonase YvrE
VQFAGAPLRKTSKATSIFASGSNGLNNSSGLHVDKSGRLWILAFGAYNGAPGTAEVFKLPLTSKSKPQYTFVLEGTSDPDHLTFDAAGNLWINSHSNNNVFKYQGPFTKSGKLSPATDLTKGLLTPAGIAFDKKGNLYVSNNSSSGKQSIAVFKTPISNKQPYFLNGLGSPGGLIFDKAGNLYASDGSPSAVARYNANNLKSGAKPNIIDKTGVSQAYASDFAISASGDLYFANCGASASIIAYPTGTKPFNSKLAPFVNFTDSYITGAGCAWGIAIK